MLGYWRRPEEEKLVYRGQWFVGGDLAAFDDEGYLWYRGRADDLMNAGGYRVSPAEVEAPWPIIPPSPRSPSPSMPSAPTSA
jgi:Acyl-CoA synthetases (AMP-forming)/AMP-acid ligases II